MSPSTGGTADSSERDGEMEDIVGVQNRHALLSKSRVSVLPSS